MCFNQIMKEFVVKHKMLLNCYIIKYTESKSAIKVFRKLENWFYVWIFIKTWSYEFDN